MSIVTDQYHGSFKMFLGELDAANKLGNLTQQVEAFVADNKVAAKSIGVEYLEDDKKAVMTLGDRADEPAYEVKLFVESLGKKPVLDAAALASLEAALGERASTHPGVICHELYVTEDNEFLVVFMTHKA
ncbi:MAG: hypothetical protein IT186_12615 [Acidobacteria bacterium]|nr:hypothetical protein [Acidobacteriota bacterium]